MVADNVRRPFLGVPGSPQLTTASERDILSQSVTISSTFVCTVWYVCVARTKESTLWS